MRIQIRARGSGDTLSWIFFIKMMQACALWVFQNTLFINLKINNFKDIFHNSKIIRHISQQYQSRLAC